MGIRDSFKHTILLMKQPDVNQSDFNEENALEKLNDIYSQPCMLELVESFVKRGESCEYLSNAYLFASQKVAPDNLPKVVDFMAGDDVFDAMAPHIMASGNMDGIVQCLFHRSKSEDRIAMFEKLEDLDVMQGLVKAGRYGPGTMALFLERITESIEDEKDRLSYLEASPSFQLIMEAENFEEAMKYYYSEYLNG